MTPAELKARWIEELRSGRWVQGKGHLLTEKGERCCLGVLCALTGETDILNLSYPYSFSTEAVGLGSEITYGLSGMNDDGQTFAEIADWIEAHDLQTGEPLS